MSSFVKFVAVLSAGLMATAMAAEKTPEEKAKKAAEKAAAAEKAKEAGEKPKDASKPKDSAEKPKDSTEKPKDSKDGGDKPKDDKAKEGEKKPKKPKKEKVVDPNAPPKTIDIPMPNGHDAKGIKIPYRDGNGKLQMRFDIGVATRLDENHIQMSDLQIETFNDQEEHEMSMDFPTSVLDLNTSVLTAQKPVRIKREDFELTGNVMIFNTRTKQGGLGGNVRMLIYNLENETDEPSANKPEPQAK